MKYEFDGWGNLTTFEQDRDSAVTGGGNDYEVSYAYAKATGGRNTLRRTSVTLPGSTTFNYAYLSTGSLLDAEASRVSQIQTSGGTPLVSYDYNGTGQVERTYLEEPDVMWKLWAGSGSYPDLDRFDRVVSSRWTADESTDRDFYSVTLAYDRNSNVVSQDDAVHAGHDVAYTNDDLNRLTRAHEGTLSGGSISSPTRDQRWTLNQTGNWELDKVDLNGDGDFVDADELQDDRTHNAVNELTARDVDDDSSDDYSLTYDAAGNLTDDGEAYKFEWDAFYRLRKVKSQSDALVSEYWYNGLGYLLTRHQDTDRDGDVDSADKKYHAVYDERWRVVGTYRGADANPKERFLYHCAGDGGYGASSYIDLCVLRDRDSSTGWTQASDGTLETRTYVLQNWRADVVAIVDSDGWMVEWAKYSAYGVPFGMPGGDTDSDGDCDATDVSQVQTWINGATYDVRGDVDLDGDVDAADKAAIEADYDGLTAGRRVLSNVSNRKGYAGYEFDVAIGQKYHVRHRVLDSALGMWMRRDPREFIDGPNVYSYTASIPVRFVDSLGLDSMYPEDYGDVERQPPPATWSAPAGAAMAALTAPRLLYLADTARMAAEIGATLDPDAGENFFRHCVGMCLTCREYGMRNARGIANAIEAKEDIKDFVTGSSEGKDDARDRKANEYGFACCISTYVDCLTCCMDAWFASSGACGVIGQDEVCSYRDDN